MTLDPGAYTTIVAGKNNTTGIATVEIYDLGTAGGDSTAESIHDNVMIGGFFVSGGNTRMIARAIGPELTGRGVAGALQDTTLTLVNSSGTIIASNDDWRSTQEQEISASNAAPTDDREAAIVATLTPGGYTAIVRGKNGTTGIASVEMYILP